MQSFDRVSNLANELEATLVRLREAINAKCWASIECDVYDINYLRDKMDTEVYKHFYKVPEEDIEKWKSPKCLYPKENQNNEPKVI